MQTPKLYDDIADLYHLIYGEWEASVQRQGEQLDALLRERLEDAPLRVLDVSCGIGTQALGLAQRGHAVHGSDVSAPAVERARKEAERLGLTVALRVADMRRCAEVHGGGYDALVSFDNSVPHLLDDAELLAAFRGFRACLRPGGLVALSVRDYAAQERSAEPQMRPFGVRPLPDGRCSVFQVWDWDADGERYEFGMYFVLERAGRAPEVRVSRARYYAVGTDRLLELLAEVGFEGAERLDGVYYQPVLLARR